MHPEPQADLYEILQISPRADRETIERVFRHLAKRYHPDNAESGSAEQFAQLLEAFRVLSDPEQRARYDARYEETRRSRWRLFDREKVGGDVDTDRRLRLAILSILYAARRADAEHPGVGPYEIERTLGCPEAHLKFHLWYMKENGWTQRLENGMLAITAAGVDRVMELGGPMHGERPRLESGDPLDRNERRQGAAAAASND
jgi:curved DNA-binding protein